MGGYQLKGTQSIVQYAEDDCMIFFSCCEENLPIFLIEFFFTFLRYTIWQKHRSNIVAVLSIYECS